MQSPSSSAMRRIREQKTEQKCSTDLMSDYKRQLSSCQQSSKYNVIRKYHENSISQFDSDSAVKSIRSDEKQEKDEIYYEDQQPFKGDLSVIEQQQSIVSSSMPMRERFGTLLLPYMNANYSIDQRKLIQMQMWLDQLLDYLRLQRNKLKGEFLSIIKANFRQNYQTLFQLDHLKQILFLKPDFYQWTQKKDQNRIDLLIALPDGAQLLERKLQFRKALFEYINKKQGFSHDKRAKIPYFIFPFTVKEDQDKKLSSINQIRNSNTFWNRRAVSADKINPFDALKPGNSQNFQQQLMLKIKQREEKIKFQKQNLEPMKFGRNELLSIFDELPKIFKTRQKSSMFKSSIIQDLDRCLNIKQGLILLILDILLEKYPSFFKVIEHKSGDIIQIQRKFYNQIRIQIEKQPLQYDKQLKQKLPLGNKKQKQSNSCVEFKQKQDMIKKFSSLHHIPNKKNMFRIKQAKQTKQIKQKTPKKKRKN